MPDQPPLHISEPKPLASEQRSDILVSGDAGAVPSKSEEFVSTRFDCGHPKKYCLQNNIKDGNPRKKFLPKLIDAIHRWERMTWDQVRLLRRDELGGVTKMEMRDMDATPPLRYNDGSDVYVLHFGDGRAAGVIEDEKVFRILWVDHKFTLYNHGS